MTAGIDGNTGKWCSGVKVARWAANNFALPESRGFKSRLTCENCFHLVFWGFTSGRKFGRFPIPKAMRNIHVRKLILCCVAPAVKPGLFYFQKLLKNI